MVRPRMVFSICSRSAGVSSNSLLSRIASLLDENEATISTVRRLAVPR
jgi:hypothetical protein